MTTENFMEVSETREHLIKDRMLVLHRAGGPIALWIFTHVCRIGFTAPARGWRDARIGVQRPALWWGEGPRTPRGGAAVRKRHSAGGTARVAGACRSSPWQPEAETDAVDVASRAHALSLLVVEAPVATSDCTYLCSCSTFVIALIQRRLSGKHRQLGRRLARRPGAIRASLARRPGVVRAPLGLRSREAREEFGRRSGAARAALGRNAGAARQTLGCNSGVARAASRAAPSAIWAQLRRRLARRPASLARRPGGIRAPLERRSRDALAQCGRWSKSSHSVESRPKLVALGHQNTPAHFGRVGPIWARTWSGFGGIGGDPGRCGPELGQAGDFYRGWPKVMLSRLEKTQAGSSWTVSWRCGLAKLPV